MENTGSRIRTLRTSKNLTQRALGTLIGVSATSINYWENEEVEPKNKNLAALARALECAPDYLLHGATTGTQGSIAPIHSRVPLITLVALSERGVDEENDAADWLYYPRQCGKKTFALIVDNDSMVSPYPNNKSYPIDTTIFVDPEVPVSSGCRVIAIVDNSAQATFKEYREDGHDRYLKPLNPQYPTIKIDDDTVLIGTIIGSFSSEQH